MSTPTPPSLLDGRKSLRLGLASVAVFSGVINVLMLASPIYSLQIFDKVLSSNSIPTLVALTVLFGMLTIAFGLMDAVRSKLLLRMGHLFDRTYAPIALDYQLGLIRSGRQGQPIKALDDLQEIRSTLNAQVLPALFDAPWVPLFLLIVFIIHPWLGLVSLVGAVLTALLVVRSQSTARKTHTDLAESHAASGASLRMMARSADSLAALGMLDRLHRSWVENRGEAWRAQLATGSRVTTLQAAIKTLRLLLQMAIYGVGAWLVIRRELSPGLLVAASIIMGRALGPAEQLAAQGPAIVSAFGALRRLLSLQSRGEGAAGTDERDLALSGAIEIDNCYALPGLHNEPVLKGINLRLADGHAIGIVGPAGSGKTALVKVMIGAIRPITGSARLGGREAHVLGPAMLRGLLGYLPERTEILPGTIRQNLSRFNDGAGEADCVSVARLVGIDDAIRRLPKGYETPLDEGGSPLSSAQARLLVLARALYGNPRIVVLDQPDLALDPDGQATLTRLLSELRKERKTVVCVTHSVRLLRLMDAVALVDRGQVRVAPAEEFLSRLVNVAHQAGGTVEPGHDERAVR
jgi:PrtD family type I secretion system ABC transporter